MTMRYERERQSSVWTVLGTILFAAVAVVGTVAIVAPGVAVGQSPSPPAPIDGIVSQWTDGETTGESPASAGSEDKTGTVGSLETESDDEDGERDGGDNSSADDGADGDDGGGSDAGDSEDDEAGD